MNLCKLLIIIAILPLMGCEHTTSEILHAVHELEEITVQIGEQSWHVEVAKTPEQRQQGLMFRESLESNAGMLFVFEKEDFHAFWMKNTLIPLDVIWISAKKKVVAVQTLAPCEIEECPSFKPIKKAQYVLEIDAKTFRGSVGDRVSLEE